MQRKYLHSLIHINGKEEFISSILEAIVKRLAFPVEWLRWSPLCRLSTAGWALNTAGGFDEFIMRPCHLCAVTHTAVVSQDYPGGRCMGLSV